MLKDIPSDVDEEVIIERSDEDMNSLSGASAKENSFQAEQRNSNFLNQDKKKINTSKIQYINLNEVEEVSSIDKDKEKVFMDKAAILKSKRNNANLGFYKPFCINTLKSCELDMDDGLDFDYFVKKSHKEFLPSSEDEIILKKSGLSDSNGIL